MKAILLPQGEFVNILKNIREAERLGLPLCQDTGVPVVYLTLPENIGFSESLYEAVREGIQKATREVPLRPNVVDPITRKNSGIIPVRGCRQSISCPVSSSP